MQDKTTASELAAQAAQLHEQGKMPGLEDVLGAVAEARKNYADKIRESRIANAPHGIKALGKQDEHE